MAEEKEVKEAVEEKNDNKSKNKSKSKNKKGFFSRIWNSLFRLRGDDFEKRLQYISKEEAALLSRMKRRSLRWRRTARNLIIFSVILELVAVGYAIMTTRTVDIDWRMRALRVLPMFLLPALSFALYYGLSSFTKYCDHRDQKTLEKLRAERQAKIEELKERTNYYTTQQLIQKYDPDPAAKAAAASVLASKLGADSGLKVFLGDESQPNAYATVKSSDVEVQQATGLWKRNQSNPRSPGSNAGLQSDNGTPQYGGNEVFANSPRGQLVVEHHNPSASGTQDGGWIARIAALLVGEDPTQSYALICGNCHMHNGLARKEEFPFITYYCPHCHALNKPKKMKDPESVTIPCQVGNLLTFHALADSSASINLMPYFFYTKLGLPEPEPIKMNIYLADKSITHPKGIIKNLLIRVDKFIFRADFVVMDIPEDEQVPIILGRPFLSTAGALSDIRNSKLTLRCGDESISFKGKKAELEAAEEDEFVSCIQSSKVWMEKSKQINQEIDPRHEGGAEHEVTVSIEGSEEKKVENTEPKDEKVDNLENQETRRVDSFIAPRIEPTAKSIENQNENATRKTSQRAVSTAKQNLSEGTKASSSQEKGAKDAKKKKKGKNLKPGDKVIVSTSKAKGKNKKQGWFGPFDVSKELEGDTIELINEKGVVFLIHKCRIRKYQ